MEINKRWGLKDKEIQQFNSDMLSLQGCYVCICKHGPEMLKT